MPASSEQWFLAVKATKVRITKENKANRLAFIPFVEKHAKEDRALNIFFLHLNIIFQFYPQLLAKAMQTVDMSFFFKVTVTNRTHIRILYTQCTGLRWLSPSSFLGTWRASNRSTDSVCQQTKDVHTKASNHTHLNSQDE